MHHFLGVPKANIISETIADVWGSDTSATSELKTLSDVVERSLAGTKYVEVL